MDEPAVTFYAPSGDTLLQDTAEGPGPAVGPASAGATTAGPGGPGQAPPFAPLPGALPPPHGPNRPGPSRAVIGAASALAVVGLGVGIAVGYAAFSGRSPSTTRTSSAASSPIDAVARGVVNIDTVLGYQTAEAAGTGMVLTATGIVLTNNHVVEGATSIRATDVGNGQTYRATVLGYDTTADVAVLKLTGAAGLSTVSIGSSASVAVGQSVVALGNAGGTGGTPKVARGSVVALDQSITAGDQGSPRTEHLTGLIETDAPIQPGDSGGPLVDSSGQVIGMDTAASTSNGFANTATGTGATVQAFAIPITAAMGVAHQIENGTSSSAVHIGETAFLGVAVAPTPTGTGARVVGVEGGSPAASAGLTAGDAITGVDGTAVTSATGLSSAMDRLHPGSTVRVDWIGATGQAASASVQLASGPTG